MPRSFGSMRWTIQEKININGYCGSFDYMYPKKWFQFNVLTYRMSDRIKIANNDGR